jgi:hypothetical protein
MDAGGVDEGLGDAGVVVVVLAEAEIATQPAEGALDDPAMGQHLEDGLVVGARRTTSRRQP